ncbi:MAG: CdaR family protein [Clostridium sp.]|nr:CdaR family protein [Acetatifactor muris]MCM1526754.1 CdaR family protein [Bacteroides sp.]MCM1562786.1 CdaR family protein [Clostridium sp.]
MRKKLLNNLGLKLISLILAFLLWFLVVQFGDPKDERDMGTIQVKLINTELLDRENKVYEVLDGTDTVRVKVYAPKSVFTQLRTSDITAEADVSKLTDINTVPITFKASNANVVSIEGSHDLVQLNVEEKAEKYVMLETTTVGTVAEGYMVASMTPDQNRIEVSGPKSAVEQVKKAGAVIDVTDATTNLTANVDIKLYDADGNEVQRANLVKNMDYVRMSVEVLATREIPVRYAYTGMPATGYMATGAIASDTDMVKIAGSAYNLSRVNEIVIPEEMLDITGESGDLVRTIDIREYLPENVRLADSGFNGRVTFTVYIEPVVEKTLHISARDISIVNVPDAGNLTVEISESAELLIPVEVEGLRDKVELLNEGNTAGVVDVAAWMESRRMEDLRIGNYVMPVTFRLDEQISISNEPSVRITVKEAE